MKTDQLLIVKFHKFYNGLPKSRDSQGRILKIVSSHDGISQRKLQEIVGIKPGSLSEVLLKLEKVGYIERRQDPDDKRRQNVYITDSGRVAFAQIHKTHEEESAHIFDALTEKDKKNLMAIFDKLLTPEERKHSEKLANDGGFEE